MAKPTGSAARFFLVLALLMALGSSRLPAAKSQEEVEDEGEFSYEMGAENGPDKWGDLREEWAKCGSGTMQSPIDLIDRRVTVGGPAAPGCFRRTYKPAPAKLKNRGYDISLQWTEDAGSIHIGGTEYHLRQCHWHSPSEHSIDGRRFLLELHVVHQSSEDETAVVGILYTRGPPDPFLLELTDSIKEIAGTRNAETDAGVVNPGDIKLGGGKYYRYLGSLTTPPCTEGVIWTVGRKVIRTASMQQVALLRAAINAPTEGNARPLQAANGRALRFCWPHTGGAEELRH